MKHVKLFEQFINERIKASEAYDTQNGVQTVIDGKRDLVFISTMDNPIYRPNNETELAAMNYGLENGLKAIEVKGKPDGRAWVTYKNNKKAAQKLADYAEKKGGYLSDNTPEEARYVGDLLGYDKKDIKAFIKRVYKVDESIFTVINESTENWTIRKSVNLMLKSSDSHPYYGKLKEADNVEAAIALAELCLEFAEDGKADEAMNLDAEHWKEVIEELEQKRLALTETEARADLKDEDDRLMKIRHFQGSIQDLDDWLRSKVGETNPHKDVIMINGPQQGQKDKSLPYQDFQNGESDLVNNRYGRKDS
jgi:hypothetical protein